MNTKYETVTIGHFNIETGEFYFDHDQIELNLFKAYQLANDSSEWDSPIEELSGQFTAMDVVVSLAYHFDIDHTSFESWDGVLEEIEEIEEIAYF